ncbi:MAG: cytochrome c [Deltaproteobacteria bacterium]|nr:cytochrome c [Deltaproteobacteria bacterium]
MSRTVIRALCGSIAAFALVIFASEMNPSHAEDSALSNPGVGPVTKIDVGPIDPKLVDQGKATFASKCSACHKFGERYVGPDLAGVTSRRSPEWIMNMILNPQEMIQKDPVAQELFGEFLVPMTFQNVSEPEARAILEYIRAQEKQ